jgi:hypothetical protein
MGMGGYRLASESLSSPAREPGWLRRLCVDHDLEEVGLEVDRIHVLEDADGEPLDAIRTPDHNTAADRNAEPSTLAWRGAVPPPAGSRRVGASPAWQDQAAACDQRPETRFARPSR